mgnify:CR=1 FL=1|jgi:hypothetical protein
MTAEVIEAGGLSVKDQFLVAAENICVRERRSLTEMGRLMVQWMPDDFEIFRTPIGLEQVILSERADDGVYKVAQATFRIKGDDDMSLVVSRSLEADLNDDALAVDMLQTFRTAFDTHQHHLCLRAIRQRRQAEVRKEKLLQPHHPAGFTVTDRRRFRTLL